MVTFKGYSNINEVLKYLKSNVYIKRSELNIDGYLIEDLIGCDVLEEESIGKVEDFLYNNGNTLLVVRGTKKFFIPLKGDYIKKVDIENKKIITNNAKDLII